MTTHIEKSIDIARSPEEVFDFLCNIDRLPDWATTVVDTRVADQPIKHGSTFKQVIRVIGKNLETEGRVTEFDRPRRMASEATAPGGGRLVMRDIVEPRGSGSHVRLDFDYDVPGGLLGDLINELYLERRATREAEHSLQNLKDILEGHPPKHD